MDAPLLAPSITPTQSGGPISNSTLETMRSQGVPDPAIAEHMATTGSPGFRQQYNQVKQDSGGDPSAIKSFLNYRFYGDANYAPNSTPEDKSFGWFGGNYIKRALDNIYNSASQNVVNAEQANENLRNGLNQTQPNSSALDQRFGGALNTVGQIGGNVASLIASPVTGALGTAMDTKVPFTNTSPNDAIGGAVGALGQTQLGQAATPYIKSGIQSVQNEYANNPTFRGAADVAKGALDTTMLYGAGSAVNQAGQLASKAIDALPSASEAAQGVAGAVVHPWQTAKNVVGGIRDAFPAPFSSEDAVKVSSSALQRTGMDERLASLVSGMSPEDQGLALESFNKAKAASTDVMAANPKEIPGATILQRYNYLDNFTKPTGKMIGNLVAANADEPVSFDNTFNNFMKGMTDKGVVVNGDGELDLTASAIPKSDTQFLQGIYDKLNPENPDAISTLKEGHLMRQNIFETQKLADSWNQGYSGPTQSIAGKVHSDMLNDIGTVNRSYQTLAKPFAEASSAKQSFANLMGFKSPEEIPDRVLKAGEIARRMLGNASADSTDIISNLDATARQYGFQSDTDVLKQIRFADMVSKYYPQFSPTGFEGGVESGAKKAAGIIGDLKDSNVISLAAKGIDYLRGRTPEDQLVALEKFLSANAEPLKNANTAQAVEDALKGILGDHYVPPVPPEPVAPELPTPPSPESPLPQQSNIASPPTLPASPENVNSTLPQIQGKQGEGLIGTPDEDTPLGGTSGFDQKGTDDARIMNQKVASGMTPEEAAKSMNQEIGQQYGAGSKKVSDAFLKSSGQKEIATNGDTTFELGSFGENNVAKKMEIKGDRFPQSQLKDALENSSESYRASVDPKNYRYDNTAWIVDLPDGKGVVYTRANPNGAQEIINWHKLSDSQYLQTLRENGSPSSQ